MAPDLFLNPIANEGETPTRVTYGEVIHPTAQDRIDFFDQPTNGLGLVATENDSQCTQ